MKSIPTVDGRVRYAGRDTRRQGHMGRITRVHAETVHSPERVQVRWDNGTFSLISTSMLEGVDTPAPCDRNRGPSPEAFLKTRYRGTFDFSDAVTGRVSHKPVHEPVEVRDSGNHGRLLGYLSRRPMPDVAARRIEVAVANRLSPADFDPSAWANPSPFRRIVFDVAFRVTDGGWKHTVFLATSAPLEDLLRIETFRLPGETDGEADTRRMRSRV